MPDIVTIGETMAVFTPKSNGPLRYIHEYTTHIAGAESNTAIGVQKLGHTARWISRLGNDELGQYILNFIRAEGVDTSGVVLDDEHRTGLMVKEFSLTNDTKVYYYRENSAASHLEEADISEELIKNTKILHFTGITPILSESCNAMIQKSIKIAQNYGVKISFDPNIRLKLWANQDHSPLINDIILNSNIIMLGIDEAEHLFHTRLVDKIFDLLFQSEKLEYAAIKDGSNGAYVATRTEKQFIPPFPCNCIDPIGAGDAFNAGFLSGILENKPLKICGEFAGIAGALSTQTHGDVESFPNRSDLLFYLENKPVIYR
ncbi:MAG: sugar kinase [Mobilitalea sp.]